MVKVVVIDSWEELQAFIPRLILWGFRGQSDASWSLTTTFERKAKESNAYGPMIWHKEYRMLRNFMRRAPYYSNSLPKQSDLFEWLSLMQHHGSPTRLLDFSYSFHIATFFALENATKDAAVWAVNLDMIRKNCMHRFSIDSRRTNTDQYNLKVLPIADSMISISGEEIKDIPLGVINVEPENLHERIINQQGLFLFPTSIKHTFEENFGISGIPHKDPNSTLSQLSSTDDGIIKFVIPYELKHQILKSLDSMNINARVLFPGLDGFARSMQHTMLGP
ncbi:FRG domain-containing protein [Vibrio parahaemolyticus]|uniref:FRG domain-containing protein n=1 Tax=Vibrio parahaemolyticus TaxID=670 RepID=UPI00111F94C3|nr:FRG domain-containing protein [Vibrio parahaemolyticus]EHK0843218.1 FRG domain-containing protein [Vibrio parahaemolyticus]EII3142039.1 FRG domain-containing protein [Vibrio parahaemolyticus]MBD2853060.1 FRG domain-containing protein [Vibrio parahaemolyticus]MEA5372523.1 FRG domain-containing protein [Vibrio parahaemolyticus]TPA32371.1 FRG domain-containing protein [Vibrio parahaemolyticus]